MKKLAICLCLITVAAVCSLGASAQTKNSSAQILDEAAPWKTGVQSVNAQACSQCIKSCADTRDRCRANACAIIGAQSNGPQACQNATNDTPANHKRFTDALGACFAQERKCDAGCPCQH